MVFIVSSPKWFAPHARSGHTRSNRWAVSLFRVGEEALSC
jgi:hypothetical protein